MRAVAGHLCARTGLTITEIIDLRLALDEVVDLLMPDVPGSVLLAEVLGRDLRFVGLGDQETREQMEKDDTPPEYIAAFFDFYAKGTLDESVVRSTVLEVTGSEPRTFEQWAVAHADGFR